MDQDKRAGDQLYLTADLGCAATLTCHGYPLLGTSPDRTSRWRVFFRFTRTAELLELAERYATDGASVNPRQFLAESARLRRIAIEARP